MTGGKYDARAERWSETAYADAATYLAHRGELVAGSGPWCDYVDGYQLLVTGDVAAAGARLARALHAPGPPDPSQGLADRPALAGA